MIDNATCGSFKYNTGEELSTVGSLWEMWLERFKLYIVAKNLPDDRIKPTYLLMIGPEAYEIYKSLRRRADDETIAEACQIMTSNFTVQRSKFAEEQKFRHMKRKQGEPVHDFIMRLRQQAVHCMFAEALERNVLSQFLAGSDMNSFQEKCCQTKDLTLKAAIQIAQAYEASAANMNMLTNPTAAAQKISYTKRHTKSQPKP